jgi:transcriptional regulator with XRE-family HTH domain
MARPSSIDKSLGSALRRAREQRGVSQQVLAVQAGVTTATLGRLETGQSDPAWSTVRAIADALEISLRDLIEAVETGEHSAT